MARAPHVQANARGAAKRTRRAPRSEPRVRLDVDARRAQLLALGVEHFGSRAYDDVSIDAIAQAAGISKGLLYHYFPTKRAFYAAVIRDAAGQLARRTETPEDADPLERLRAGLDAYLDFVRAHGRAYSALMRSGVGVDPEIARIVDETRALFVERLTSGFARASLPGLLGAPLVRVALRGWVGFAEAVSLAWIDAETAQEPAAPAPSREAVRDLLAASLMKLVETAATMA